MSSRRPTFAARCYRCQEIRDVRLELEATFADGRREVRRYCFACSEKIAKAGAPAAAELEPVRGRS